MEYEGVWFGYRRAFLGGFRYFFAFIFILLVFYIFTLLFCIITRIRSNRQPSIMYQLLAFISYRSLLQTNTRRYIFQWALLTWGYLGISVVCSILEVFEK